MPRLGLCCLFLEQPIKFRTTTAKYLWKLEPTERSRKLAEIVADNAMALEQAILFCEEVGIGAFRINSQILPLKTHPEIGWRIDDLPNGGQLREAFIKCGRLASQLGIRLSFHPDQFVVLNSPRPEVVASSIRELEYQAEVAEWVGADVINLHGGGAYGDKVAALARLENVIESLSPRIKQRLTLENDDRIYTPEELLPVCQATDVPLVYDVHHHRCNPDGLTVEAATQLARKTWNREPLLHISSPKEGWGAENPRPHHDYIDISDFPDSWRELSITIDVEAKAKELAVLHLQEELDSERKGTRSRA